MCQKKKGKPIIKIILQFNRQKYCEAYVKDSSLNYKKKK